MAKPGIYIMQQVKKYQQNKFQKATFNKGAKGTDGRGQCIVLGCVDVVYGFDLVKVLKLQKKGAHYVVITLKN